MDLLIGVIVGVVGLAAVLRLVFLFIKRQRREAREIRLKTRREHELADEIQRASTRAELEALRHVIESHPEDLFEDNAASLLSWISVRIERIDRGELERQ